MKFKTLLFLSLVMAAGAINAETLYMAKITDMIGNVGYKIMTREEYSAASKEIMEEKKIFSKVVAECKAEWKADPDRKGYFQSSKVKARKISKSGATYTSMEKAEAKLDRLEEGVTDKHLKKLDDNAKRFKKMDDHNREREAAKINGWRETFEMVSKKMSEKLGREVPDFGFDLIVPEPKK